jgi:hypothetical protein
MKTKKIIRDLETEAPDRMSGVEFTEHDANYVRNLVKRHKVPYEDALRYCLAGVEYSLDLKFVA